MKKPRFTNKSAVGYLRFGICAFEAVLFVDHFKPLVSCMHCKIETHLCEQIYISSKTKSCRVMKFEVRTHLSLASDAKHNFELATVLGWVFVGTCLQEFLKAWLSELTYRGGRGNIRFGFCRWSIGPESVWMNQSAAPEPLLASQLLIRNAVN